MKICSRLQSRYRWRFSPAQRKRSVDPARIASMSRVSAVRVAHSPSAPVSRWAPALSEFQDADLLIVPAIWRQPQRVLRRHAEQIRVIKRHIEADRLTISVGSGSFLLAETGAMRGRSMTTHWQWFDAFARRYAAVNLERRQLITQSGAVFCVAA